jgi:Glutathione S-transferase, N-terminal domain
VLWRTAKTPSPVFGNLHDDLAWLRSFGITGFANGIPMRLYDYGPSQNCFKVRLLAAHLGVALEIVPVSIFKGEGASPEFLAKNPMGSVPMLETDSGEYLPESNADSGMMPPTHSEIIPPTVPR